MTLHEGAHVSGEESETSEALSREKIVSPALQYEGERFLGHDHGLALIELQKKYPVYNEDAIESGFTTSAGRFVLREEAHDIAVANKQAKAQEDGKLRSENLH